MKINTDREFNGIRKMKGRFDTFSMDFEVVGDGSLTKKIDEYAITKLGIPEIILMENAAFGAVEELKVLGKHFLLVCSVGNNGGDGFAIARHLFSLGKSIDIIVIGDVKKATESCYKNMDICKRLNINILFIEKKEDLIIISNEMSKKDSVVVDCLFGTGLNREIKGLYKDIIELINERTLGNYVVSIDLPSGMDSKTGKIFGTCIKANMTISFEFYKLGFLNYKSFDYTGKIIIKYLGLPYDVRANLSEKIYFLDEKILSLIPTKKSYAHKGDSGRVFIIAGSKRMPGAAKISSSAAVASGSGLVTCYTNEDTIEQIGSSAFEFMVDKYTNISYSKVDSIGFGPGFGKNKEKESLLTSIIDDLNVPIVVDADGLDMLKEICLNRSSILDSERVIITPHVGELARILDKEISEINSNRIESAIQASKKLGVICLLKGKYTVITDGYITFINPTGNSHMANGGMGDALLGIITSYSAMGIKPLYAAALSAYIHGLCGDVAANDKYTVTARDVIKLLPIVMNKYNYD